jgi:hypothetical protein
MSGGTFAAAANWTSDQVVDVHCTEAAVPCDGLDLVEYIGASNVAVDYDCYRVIETVDNWG